jgi:hypothetical protein
LKVNINDEEKEVQFQMRGKHIKKIMKAISEVSEEETEDKKQDFHYIDVLHTVAKETVKFAGTEDLLQESDFDEMDADSLNKIINEIQKKALGSLTFLRSSLK